MMKRTTMAAIALLTGMTWMGPAQARELFVARQHPAAEGIGNGSEEKPFMAIQPAVDAAQPGDIIWVKAGDYEEPVKIRKAGTPNQRITLRAPQPTCGGFRPALSGSAAYRLTCCPDRPTL